MSTVHILLLLSLQISEEQRSFVIPIGSDVTLPCGGVSQSQTLCTGTTWTKKDKVKITTTKWDAKLGDVNHPNPPFGPPSLPSPPGPEFEGSVRDLVRSGSVRPFDESHRLNLTESCGLQIRDVEEGDVGVYVCTQLDQSQSSSELGQSQRSESVLSVVKWFGRVQGSSAELFCDVTPYGGQSNCGFTVRWLFPNSDQNQTRLRFETSTCSAKVEFSPTELLTSLICEVTDLNHPQVHFFPKNPHGGSQENQTQVQTEDKPEESYDSFPVLSLLMLVMRSVELLMVSVVMVILLRVHSRCSSVNNHQESEGTKQFRKNKSHNTRVELSLV